MIFVSFLLRALRRCVDDVDVFDDGRPGDRVRDGDARVERDGDARVERPGDRLRAGDVRLDGDLLLARFNDFGDESALGTPPPPPPPRLPRRFSIIQ